MRKVLLLAALCALATFTFASAAQAQDDTNCDDYPTQAAAQAALEADPSDPNNLDADDDMQACEDSGLPAGDSSGMSTSASQSTSQSASPMSSASASSATTATVSSSSAASASTSTSGSATASVLAETGGLASPLALISLALLVGGGILAAGIVRRN